MNDRGINAVQSYLLWSQNKRLIECHAMLSQVQLSVTPRIIALQAPLFMEFSRQECWSVLPFPPLVDLPYPGIKPESPALAGGFFFFLITVSPLVKGRGIKAVTTLFAMIPK